MKYLPSFSNSLMRENDRLAAQSDDYCHNDHYWQENQRDRYRPQNVEASFGKR